MLIHTCKGKNSVPRPQNHAVICSSPSGYLVGFFLNVQNTGKNDHFSHIPKTPHIFPQHLYLFIPEYLYDCKHGVTSYTEHQFLFKNLFHIWISADTAGSQPVGFVDNILTSLQATNR
jgi:hypothetical protein